jgi:hypothetical protein
MGQSTDDDKIKRWQRSQWFPYKFQFPSDKLLHASIRRDHEAKPECLSSVKSQWLEFQHFWGSENQFHLGILELLFSSHWTQELGLDNSLTFDLQLNLDSQFTRGIFKCSPEDIWLIKLRGLDERIFEVPLIFDIVTWLDAPLLENIFEMIVIHLMANDRKHFYVGLILLDVRSLTSTARRKSVIIVKSGGTTFDWTPPSTIVTFWVQGYFEAELLVSLESQRTYQADFSAFRQEYSLIIKNHDQECRWS